jgi:elongation factor G
VPIPEDMLEEVKEYRSILIEAEYYDENLLEKFMKMKTLLQRKKSTLH